MTGTGDADVVPLARRNGKSEAAFRTISEVAEELDVPQHVLRFWESKFPQVRPLKRGGGRRYYRPEDVALLRRIRDLLYSEGYTIKGVQKLLREGGYRDPTAPAPVARTEPELPLPVPLMMAAENATEEQGVAEQEGEVVNVLPEPTMADAVDSEDTSLSLPALISSAFAGELADLSTERLSPEIRQELALLLDDLEQIRSLLEREEE